MYGNALAAELENIKCTLDNIWVVLAARITQGRELIDVDGQLSHADLRNFIQFYLKIDGSFAQNPRECNDLVKRPDELGPLS